jgi:hypothetical protein
MNYRELFEKETVKDSFIWIENNHVWFMLLQNGEPITNCLSFLSLTDRKRYARQSHTWKTSRRKRDSKTKGCNMLKEIIRISKIILITFFRQIRKKRICDYCSHNLEYGSDNICEYGNNMHKGKCDKSQITFLNL